MDERTHTVSQIGLHRPFGKYQSDLPHNDKQSIAAVWMVFVPLRLDLPFILFDKNIIFENIE